MDVLKLIPQLFYDLISRVLPGGVAIIAITAAVDRKVGKIVIGLLEGIPVIQQSSFFLAMTILTCAYIVGHLIGPLSAFVERNIIAKLFPSSFHVLKNTVSASSGDYLPDMQNFLTNELNKYYRKEGTNEIKDRQYTRAIFLWYDWLRIYNPDVGARITKIRAEYRMYGEITIAMVIAFILHLSAIRWGIRPNWVLIILTFSIGTLSLWGLTRMYRIFQWTIINHYYIERNRSKE